MYLLQGQFAMAHIYHPLILLSLAICLYLGPRHTVFRKTQTFKAEKVILIGIFIIYIGVFAVRMAFLFPHSEPLIPLETALWRLVVGWLL